MGLEQRNEGMTLTQLQTEAWYRAIAARLWGWVEPRKAGEK